MSFEKLILLAMIKCNILPGIWHYIPTVKWAAPAYNRSAMLAEGYTKTSPTTGLETARAGREQSSRNLKLTRDHHRKKVHVSDRTSDYRYNQMPMWKTVFERALSCVASYYWMALLFSFIVKNQQCVKHIGDAWCIFVSVKWFDKAPEFLY